MTESTSRYSRIHGRIRKGESGTRFLHRQWYNSRFSLAEIQTLPREQTALLCEVTSIRKGMIYYRPVYQWEDRETYGSPAYFPFEKFDDYALLVNP